MRCTHIWERITDQNGSPRTSAMAIGVLMSMYHAVRPLSPAELIDGISVVPMTPEFDTDGLTRSTILDIWQNLVVFDEELGVLRFAHFSVQEFLLVKHKSAECHTSIAEVCLTLLTYHSTTSHGRALALLEYSASNWPAHVKSSGTGSDDLKRLWSDFLKPCPAYDSWVTAVSGKNYDFRPMPGRSLPPVLIACYYQLSDIFEHLLDVGADFNDTNRYMRNSLHMAAKYGNVHAVELLLEKGADPECKDREWGILPDVWYRRTGGVTPMSFAADNGHESVVRILLENGVSADNDDQFVTPLWRAARGDHSKVVRVLLGAGGDVDAQDSEGRSPLWWGARNDSVDVVQMLLDNGASVDIRDLAQRTPLNLASFNRCERVVRMLVGNSANVDGWGWLPPLVAAAQNGYENVVQILLDKGAEVDTQGVGNERALLCAARSGDEKVVQILLEKEAEVDSMNIWGRTPLCCAVERGYQNVVEMLLAKGADVARTESGRTPLSWARMNRHLEVAQLLTSRRGQ